MRRETCLFINRDLSWFDTLQQCVKPEVISIIPIMRLWAPADPQIRLNLHTAILFTPDLLIGEPKEVIRQLREEDSQIVAIAMLTHHDDILEQELLCRGCDDVMTTPICVDTLAARLLLRIRQRGWSIGSSHIIQIYDITIDFRELRIHRNGNIHTLSRGLADLLQFFLINANQVISRREVCETLWSDHVIDHEGKNLDMHITKLRRLLEPSNNGRPRLIETIRGVGYRLNLPSNSDKIQVDVKSTKKFLASQAKPKSHLPN